MKAIRIHQFGPPEVMTVETVAAPKPTDDQVLVRIEAAGVNPVDTYLRSGLYRPDLPLPWTPGIDGAGIVESVGAGVRSFEAGQRVYVTAALSGTYAERAVVAENRVFPLPDTLSFAEGAALGVPYFTAYRALFQRAHAQPGESVLIHGASGGVGLAAVQWAKAAGLMVIGTAGTEEGISLVQREGAHGVLNHREPDYLESLRQSIPDGVDVILEMLANVNLGRDLPLLAKGGRVVVIGSRGPVEINPRDTMGQDSAILGMRLFNATSRDLAIIHAALTAGVEQNTLRPVISHEWPLKDAPLAHHTVIEKHSLGKIVLVP